MHYHEYESVFFTLNSSRRVDYHNAKKYKKFHNEQEMSNFSVMNPLMCDIVTYGCNGVVLTLFFVNKHYFKKK